MTPDRSQPYRPERSHHPDYGLLTVYLQSCPDGRITLTFTQLETEILPGPLPYWARINRGWWSNTPRGHAHQNRAWLEVGWRVAAVDLLGGVVTFER